MAKLSVEKYDTPGIYCQGNTPIPLWGNYTNNNEIWGKRHNLRCRNVRPTLRLGANCLTVPTRNG